MHSLNHLDKYQEAMNEKKKSNQLCYDKYMRFDLLSTFLFTQVQIVHNLLYPHTMMMRGAENVQRQSILIERFSFCQICFCRYCYSCCLASKILGGWFIKWLNKYWWVARLFVHISHSVWLFVSFACYLFIPRWKCPVYIRRSFSCSDLYIDFTSWNVTIQKLERKYFLSHSHHI